MRRILKKYKLLTSLLLALGTLSCEEFVQVDMPNSQINSEAVFDNDETAIAAATGMYNTMLNARSFIGQFHPISYLGGLSSDELVDHTGSARYAEFYDNQLSINNSAVLEVWSSGYKTIYEANSVINGVSTSTSLSPAVKKQLEGEAKFTRAFCYFYLVNLFGDVPLVTSTDYRKNATLGRASTTEVYELIKSDLLEAKELLTDEYFMPGKVRPNRFSAAALLARVYLFTGDYVNAELEASMVIGSGIYNLQSDLNRAFLASNPESILELSQVHPNGFPTADGTNFLLNQYIRSSSLTSTFLKSFDSSDLRYSHWIISFDGSYYTPYKYKVWTYSNDANYPENLVLLRVAEQYLVRAEARAEQGDVAGAQSDLNVIRNRAGLADTDASDLPALRLAIGKERRFELFCEMGHRWLDLKRTNQADAVLRPLKSLWNSTDVYYPIPEQEMLNNPKLTPQNDGY